MAWRSVGSVTVGPAAGPQVVGLVTVPPSGGVEVRVKQTTASRGFRFAYGLLSFQSVFGRELGTIKVWPDPVATDYRLGAGMSAQARSGTLVFDARSYNLRWVMAGFPLGVSFEVDEPSDLPPDRYQPTGFQDMADRLLRVVGVGQQGRIQF
jgi:hypothetical protein